MLKIYFKNYLHFLASFAIQKEVETFIDKFFDYVDFFCKNNEKVFFIIFEN